MSTVPASRRPLNLAFFVLALVLLLTTVSTWSVNQLAAQQQRTRFLREADTVTQSVEQRLDIYIEAMRSARGLWSVNSEVSRDDFARYIDSLELIRNYPGIQGIGYAEYVRPGQLGAFEARLRRQGLPSFRVRPVPAQDAYVPVTYLEPRNEANAYAMGFDMHSEALRRAAIERALTNGEAAATAPVTLVQEKRKESSQSGFLIYLPIYENGVGLRTVEERRAALRGFLYAAFRTGDFLSGVDRRTRYGEIDLRVSDDAATMYGEIKQGAQFFDSHELNVAGRTWKLEFSAPPEFGQNVFSLTPWVVLVVGLSIALAAFWTTNSQVRARERAEEMSSRLARSRASLTESRAEFAAIFQAMQDTALFAGPTGEVRLSNAALNRTFGYATDELQGRNLSSLRVSAEMPSQNDFNSSVARYRRKDGSEFTGEVQRSFVRNEAGEVIGQLEVVRDMTERLEAERALRESELRYQGVLEAMPQLVWVTDPQGRHRYFNSGWYAFTGLSPDESVDFGFAKALHPDDVERSLLTWERSWRYGEPYEIEYRFRRFDGEYHWFVGRASPIHNAEGQVIEWVGTCTDIHERIEFEGQLRRSEARYRGLIEGMPQIVWLSDPRGETTYFNRRWAEYVGEQRAGGGLSEEVVHPHERATFTEQWGRSLHGKVPFEGEYRLVRADGEYRTFMVRSLPILGEDGAVIEWVGTLTDVEDQVYSEASSRLLAEISRVLAVPLGETRDIPRVLRLLTERFADSAALWLRDGVELHETIESRPHVNFDVLEGRQEDIEQYVRGIIERGESDLVASNDTLYAMGLSSVLAIPLIARGEQPLGALFLGYRHVADDRDQELAHEVAARLATAIDNQRLFRQASEAEREVKELNQTLELRVEMRTQELLEANRELEAFSYSVSHDLRTPLRHIVGFGDLLGKEAGEVLGDKGQRYLNIITGAATRMSALIDDLLNFSRMGRQEMRFAEVDLNTLLHEAIEELDVGGAAVKWELGPLPHVPGDPGLLKLVFTNLLSNALKYSRTRAERTVSVTARLGADETIVAVRDNGVGFDSRFADKLFGVFQRLHRAEEFEGTGIGLANVRRIVTRHGGRVWAESTLGEGATFYIALPLQSPHAAEQGLHVHVKDTA